MRFCSLFVIPPFSSKKTLSPIFQCSLSLSLSLSLSVCVCASPSVALTSSSRSSSILRRHRFLAQANESQNINIKIKCRHVLRKSNSTHRTELRTIDGRACNISYYPLHNILTFYRFIKLVYKQYHTSRIIIVILFYFILSCRERLAFRSRNVSSGRACAAGWG